MEKITAGVIGFLERFYAAYAERLVKSSVESLLELIEDGFFEPGDRYGVERFMKDPIHWNQLAEEPRVRIIKALGEYLQVDLISPPETQIIRRYHEEGVPGELSEGGAEVIVLPTKFPQLEIHVMSYKNQQIGIRYDLVRAK